MNHFRCQSPVQFLVNFALVWLRKCVGFVIFCGENYKFMINVQMCLCTSQLLWLGAVADHNVRYDRAP